MCTFVHFLDLYDNDYNNEETVMVPCSLYIILKTSIIYPIKLIKYNNMQYQYYMVLNTPFSICLPLVR